MLDLIILVTTVANNCHRNNYLKKVHLSPIYTSRIDLISKKEICKVNKNNCVWLYKKAHTKTKPKTK